MLKVSDISAWLSALGVAPAPVDSAFLIPPQPGRMIVLALAGGPGDTLERAFDRLALHVECFGLQRQYADGEALATQVDNAILGVTAPIRIGGTFVNDIDRIGAPPRFMGVDKSFRPAFGATYLLQYAF